MTDKNLVRSGCITKAKLDEFGNLDNWKEEKKIENESSFGIVFRRL